jgi:hypothetical protein
MILERTAKVINSGIAAMKRGIKMKPTFLNYDKPLLTAMIQCLPKRKP